MKIIIKFVIEENFVMSGEMFCEIIFDCYLVDNYCKLYIKMEIIN